MELVSELRRGTVSGAADHGGLVLSRQGGFPQGVNFAAVPRDSLTFFEHLLAESCDFASGFNVHRGELVLQVYDHVSFLVKGHRLVAGVSDGLIDQ